MILAYARQRFGQDARQAQKVGLMVALQESKLRMYANNNPDYPGVEESLNYPHDAVGNDHDSLNFFQQRWPMWGTIEQLMNPDYAIAAFYNALDRVDNWQDMDPGKAGQTVQRSDYPDAYAKWEEAADKLIDTYPEGGR